MYVCVKSQGERLEKEGIWLAFVIITQHTVQNNAYPGTKGQATLHNLLVHSHVLLCVCVCVII